MVEQKKRLKIIRATLGLNQDEMAEKLNIKQGSYSAIENGKTKISPTMRERLIFNLRVNPLYLDNGIEPPILSDIATVRDRIIHLITHFQMDIRVFATFMGMTDVEMAKFTLMLQSREDPDDSILKLICAKFPDVSYRWLKDNVQPMFIASGERQLFSEDLTSLPKQINDMVNRLNALTKENEMLRELNTSLREQIDMMKKSSP